MPAARSRSISASPIATAVVTCPAVVRQVVEGQAQRRLGEHLRRLVVAGVAARDLGDHPPAAALADEPHREPGLRPLLARSAPPRA